MKELSTRQAIILLVFAIISTKIQRFPAILAEYFGKNGWLFLLFDLAIGTAMLLVVLRISVLSKGKTIHQKIAQKFGKPFSCVFSILLSMFFLLKLATPYKGTHEFFVTAIFDELDWKWFSFLFLLLILFIASNGLNRIGRTAEIFSYFVALGFLGVIVLALTTTNFENLLPIEIFSAQKFFDGIKRFVQWNSDVFLVAFFIGRVKEHKFKTAMATTYVITSVIIIFAYIIFYGIYDNMSTLPNVGILALTEFSLLSQDIGRVDWFLALFVMLSSVVTTGLFALIASECLSFALNLPKKYISVAVVLFLFVMDIYVFKTAESFINISFNYLSWFIVAINFVIIPLVWLLLEFSKNKPNKVNYFAFKTQPKSIMKLRLKLWKGLRKKQVEN